MRVVRRFVQDPGKTWVAPNPRLPLVCNVNVIAGAGMTEAPPQAGFESGQRDEL